jgi:hypothetical protein
MSMKESVPNTRLFTPVIGRNNLGDIPAAQMDPEVISTA